jgi:alpha-L-rhamnosidase
VSSHSTGSATVYDFGSVVAGRVRCVVSGTPLAEIRVKYGEYLSIHGAVVCDNILAAGEAQVDTFVLPPGADRTTWEPEFSYKGFRYVGVEASAGVTLHDIQAIPLHNDVRRVGEFDCQDETLTWIVAATERTFLNNLHGIPTDTPIYEKNGWTADAHLASESVLHSFDLRSLFKKWLDDHVDSQQPDGVVPQIVPSPGWGSAPDPAWSASMVLIPWNLYWEYGDKSILERYVASILRYTDRLLEISGNGLWPLHSWGDWLAPGFELAPEGAVPTATMMLHHVASRTGLICRELGFNDLADHYTQAANNIADAYHREFFDHQSGHYGASGTSYRQTMNVLPLAFGAVPEQHVRSVANSLMIDIETRTAGHLDCGAIGVKYLLPVLTDHGRPDLAITVASQETRPGWGVWRKAGAQTLMESWDTTARSLNHYFLGSSAAWIQQRIAGLRSTAPGWKCFDVSPVLDTRINRARIVHDSIRGPVSVEWSRSDNHMDVHLVVPPGATARLALPGGTPSIFKCGTHDIALALDPVPMP